MRFLRALGRGIRHLYRATRPPVVSGEVAREAESLRMRSTFGSNF